MAENVIISIVSGEEVSQTVDSQSMTTPIPDPPSLASIPPAMGFVA